MWFRTGDSGNLTGRGLFGWITSEERIRGYRRSRIRGRSIRAVTLSHAQASPSLRALDIANDWQDGDERGARPPPYPHLLDIDASMSGDIRTVLEAQHQALEELYTEHLHAVQDLQTVLITDILPGLADELDWDGGTVEFAREWLNDTGMQL